ncbi:MAG TPA: class I SAM-dependent methyltransferase [Streptosporangiaceae bacterium]|nr:class I SAM-dependent methyltransferase [Streptosporangiaceae bacterium]
MTAAGVGTGPGPITPDGCAVDFYALLPPMGEPPIVHAAVPEAASIVELGCGTGRLLRPLAALGHPVLGVDESPDMLAHVPDLPTVCSRIETLRLDRRFGAVLLASTMVNADPQTRRSFLATCRRHIGPDGVVVIQQHPPDWFDTVCPREPEAGGIWAAIRSVERDGTGIRVVIEYRAGGRAWTHAFTPHRVSETELTSDLASADLVFGRWLTQDRAWFTARPAAHKEHTNAGNNSQTVP